MFAGFCCSYGENMRTINFVLNTATNEKNFDLKNDVIITCPKTSKFCVCITKRGINKIQKGKRHF